MHRHARDDTLRELHAIATQVKPGGTILGDDWQPEPGKLHHGVFQAVQNFTAQTDWRLISCNPARQLALRRFPGPDAP